MNKKQKEKRERNKLDKEWAKLVKERDFNKCVICGETKRLNAHHIIPREIKEFRHNINNGITLCPRHHKFDINLSAHRNPFTFFIWFITYRKEQYLSLL